MGGIIQSNIQVNGKSAQFPLSKNHESHKEYQVNFEMQAISAVSFLSLSLPFAQLGHFP